ncbi:MAG: 2-succinyl-5-enolpyruvyl-6-hydroxy-3-cyclohexene-1-carboxylic-acid synthase, partial [Rhodothermales bacterium]
AMVLTTVDQAVYQAMRVPQGPVHLNCMFREPLAPTPGEHDYTVYATGLAAWRDDPRPYTRYVPAKNRIDPGDIDRLWKGLREVERGLLVVGRLDTPNQAEAVQRLADQLGWPLLPDIGSQMRLGQKESSHRLIGYYDQMLGSDSFGAAHAPEAVLHIGGRPTSKRLSQFLARSRPKPYIVVNATPFRLDPHHQVTHRIESDVTIFCRAFLEAIRAHPVASAAASDWSAEWQQASRRAEAILDDFFDEAHALSEPLVARLLSHHLPEGHGLVLAGSMPIRDMDMYAVLDGPPAPVATNRGASGIDGLVATAAGFSAGLEVPVTLLLGDLALLHDLNSLALLGKRPVVLVVLNNDGGGIFHFLPIAEYADVFEPYFGTPHGFTFEAAAAMFGIAYHHASGPQDFLQAYRTAGERQTGTLIEVPTNRKTNHALHRQILTHISEAVA